MHFDTLNHYTDKVRFFRSFNEVKYLLEKVSQDLQADHYAWTFGDGEGRMINFDNRPENWMDIYNDKTWFYLDPIVQKVLSNEGEFAWDELDKDKRLSATQKVIMGQASDFGLKNGFVFPNSGPGPEKSSLSFISQFSDYPDEAIVQIQLPLKNLAYQLHNQARKIIAHQKNLLRPQLSEREKEVMSFSAEGFSIIETAEKLGLGQSTIKKHRESAMLKLGANNITHAVSLAMHHNIIHPMHIARDPFLAKV